MIKKLVLQSAYDMRAGDVCACRCAQPSFAPELVDFSWIKCALWAFAGGINWKATLVTELKRDGAE